MRVLKPEVARRRKENILNWVVHRYVTSGRPVSSESVFEGGNFNLSPATIRSILKELEEEGYLNQLHTSGGRVPSDKGYRAYVDTILSLQNMAEEEKNRLDIEYDRRMEQLDSFLRNTSKILAEISKMAGFSIFSDISEETLKRLDIVKISKRNYLSIVVTDANIIKHIPFNLDKSLEKQKLRAITSQLNERLKGVKIKEIGKILFSIKVTDESEKALYRELARIIKELLKQDDALYLEGLSGIFSSSSPYDYSDLVNVARLLEEKEKFLAFLREKLKDCSSSRSIELPSQPSRKRVDVTIGSESSIKEFKNFSMVSSSYCLNDKAVGLVGVIGYKRMEYQRVISIVDAVSSMMEEALSRWEDFDQEGF